MARTDMLEIAVEVGVPVLLWGPPGAGKTSAIQSLCKARGWHVEIVIASIREPSDFMGLPVIKDGQTRFAPPDWAVRLAQSSGRAVLYLDEINTAPPAVQAALLRVVLERCVGDLQLPASVRVVAAANPPDIAASGWELSPPLANRFCHLQWEVDAGWWANHYPHDFPLSTPLGIDQSAIDAELPRAKSMVAGFIRRKPSALADTPQDGVLAFASPRSWDNAARLVAGVLAARLSLEEALPLIAGCVGEGHALEFFTWAREANLPSPDIVLGNVAVFDIPERGDIAFAVLTACALHAVKHPEVHLPCWELLAKAAQQGKADIAAVVAGTLARHKPAGVVVPADLIAPFTALLKEVGA